MTESIHETTVDTQEPTEVPDVPKEDLKETEPINDQLEEQAEGQTPKASVSKRRSLFNPFGKSKKEEEEAAEESAEKKRPKGFGSFFSRTKSNSKIITEDTAVDPSTELPQIEKYEPIESVETTVEEEDSQKTESDPVPSDVAAPENPEQQPTNKRQSFISKIFSKKKQEEIPKEVPEEVVETTETPEEVEETHEARPSSPLGRFTELFSKKKKSKTPEIPAEEPLVEPKVEQAEQLQDVNPVESPAVVLASA